MPARGDCAFCGERADITAEHLWSAWAETVFGPRRYRYIQREDESIVATWQKDRLDLKAKVVCAECNNRWMSDLETATKSVTKDMMLSCAETTLSARDLATIAAFGLTKAVVADHMHTHRPPILTLAERRLFASDLTFPSGVQMWLASMEVPHGLFKSHYAETPSEIPRGFYLEAFTYGIGYFVIQVVICRFKKKSLRRHAKQPTLSQHLFWSRYSIPFWPHSGTPLRWPPSLHLSNQLVDKFVKRWAHLNIT
jgi:hypothetical protein